MPFYDCEPGVVSYNVIMNALVDCGYFDQAHKVYMRMVDRGIAADTCTYTVRIKAFCLTERPHMALRLLRNMPERGFDVSGVTYCTVVSGLYENGFTSDARKVYCCLAVVGGVGAGSSWLPINSGSRRRWPTAFKSMIMEAVVS